MTIVYCDLISGVWRGIWRRETLLDVFMALTNFRSVKQRSYSIFKKFNKPIDDTTSEISVGLTVYVVQRPTQS